MTTRSLAFAVTGPALLASAACGSPTDVNPPGIEFAVSAASYTPRDTILAILYNRSKATIGYNLCFAKLQRRVVGGWEAVPRLPDDFVCTLAMHELEPGKFAALRQQVFNTMPRGTYRFHDKVTRLPSYDDLPVVSDSFEIVPD